MPLGGMQYCMMPAKLTPHPSRGGRPAARSRLFAAAVMVLAALGVAAAWWLMSPFPPPVPHTKDHIALASEAPSSAERLRAPAPSIVVLPFVNLSGDAQQDYLA